VFPFQGSQAEEYSSVDRKAEEEQLAVSFFHPIWILQKKG
jgi:hypothetical protein